MTSDLNLASNPLITIVIATYNSRRYLDDLVESLGAQTDKRFACIFVDDGSKDDGADFLESRLGVYRGWQIHRKTPEGHPGKTFNYGAKITKTPWIIFLGSDDLLHPDAIAIYIRAIEQFPSAAMIVPGYKDFFFGQKPDWDSIVAKNVSLRSEDFLPSLLMRNELTASGAVLSLHRFAELGYYPEDRRFKVGEDYFIWLRLARVSKGVKVDAELVHICKHESNTSSNKENLALGLEAIGHWFEENNDRVVSKALLAQAFKTRGLSVITNKPLRAVIWLLKSFFLKPRKDTFLCLFVWPLIYLIKKRILRLEFLDRKLGIRGA
jgi:glycosyltransferase involved in cell wall biosynthesis